MVALSTHAKGAHTHRMVSTVEGPGWLMGPVPFIERTTCAPQEDGA